MVSLCLKSFNKQNLDKLELYFDKIEFPGIFYSQRKFKNFYNLIIHYKGPHENRFYDLISEILSDFIINNYENNILNTQLKLEFFYFSLVERKEILDHITNVLSTSENIITKKSLLKKSFNNYIMLIHRCNLDGFINFRIYEYKTFLNTTIEKEIHNYILQKEYSEYVSLLKEYMSIKPPQTDSIHLIYSDKEKFLLDDKGNIITTTNQKKYLSDISFSTNDFILNSIISLMPKKIIIHLEGEEDNFIQFLKLVFENKHHVCKSCNLCSNYLQHFEKSTDTTIISPIY